MKNFYLYFGLLGGVFMYLGDMMLYGTRKKIPYCLSEEKKVILFLLQRSSLARIFIGGILGPIAATFNIIGFLHISYMAPFWAKTLASILFGLFTLGFAFGGAYHMAWIFLGHAAHSDDEKYLAMIEVLFSKLKPIVFGLLAIPTFLLSIFVFFGGLGISPWYVVMTPAVLLFLLPIVKKVSQPFGIWLWGGWINLVFVIYYAVLIVSLP